MGIPPSGEHTAMTREEYLRQRDKEAKQPERKRTTVHKSSYSSWGSECVQSGGLSLLKLKAQSILWGGLCAS